MELLFPTKHKQIFIDKGKDEVFLNITKHTEKVKRFRFIFSNHKPFEGKISKDDFKLKYIGKLARNYKVEIDGKLFENNQKTVLNLKTKVTKFGRIYTYLWLFIMTFVTLFTIYLTISQSQLIILTFTMFSILLLLVVLTVSYFGYRNESAKVLSLIEEIITGKK